MADDTNVDDLASLSQLDDTVLLGVLKNRYKNDKIYTYVGDILIAINPFKELNIYGKDVSQKYKFVTKKSEQDPHIYALADLAYQSMLGRRGLQPANQCFLISGESGAGKTESTKLILRQLMELCNGNTQLEQQILQVNPLLEAFGNAQTLMNDNSSRFGKFIQLKFHNGQVLGAKISEYLLEKSRLVKQTQGEQNFHVFYYLFAGKSPEDLNILQLKPGQPYRYLGKGLNTENHGKSQVKYDELINALDLVGFKDQEQADMFTILAGILHLGEVVFSMDQSEAAVIQDSASSQEILTACRFLGIDVTEVSECLTSSISVTRGEYVKRSYTIHQAQDSRDAMAKALYGRLFGWIVNKVNCLVTPKQFVSPADTQEIGILDIFGFEHFESNSFEQACINLANEQLQLFFNQYVFKLEQEEYTKEGIDWTEVKFADNQHLLDLFLIKPIGILSLLDEECFFPTGSDQSFVDKLNRNFSSLPCYTKSKHSSINFTITHYAGKVSYDGSNWLEKNRDTFPAGITEVLQTSSNPLIKLIFGARITRTGSLALQTKRVTTKKAINKSLPEGSKRKVTVSAQFRSSLLNLMERMKSATPVFVRCLKPNHHKVPNQFDSQYVLAQLLYTGMLETTRIRKNGFAVRATFAEFVDKYKLLVHTPNLEPSAEACRQILNNSGITGWHVGKSKVFLKDHHVDSLVQRLLKLDQCAVHIQRVARGFVSRQEVKRLREVARQEQEEIAAMATQVEQLSAAVANQQQELCHQDEAAAKEKALSDAAAASPPADPPVPPAVENPTPDPRLSIHSSQSPEAQYGVVIKEQASEKTTIPENGRSRTLKDRSRLSTIRESARSVSSRNSSSDFEEVSDDSFEPESDSEDDYFRSKANPIQSWFKETQTKGLLQLNGKFPEWFHGVISRRTAENLLDRHGVIGSFLVRVSEVRFGYCLSFKAEDRCRHYMIDQLLNKKYVIVGESKVHSSLSALVMHHQKNHISNWAGFLTIPCGQRGGVTDYEDLFDQQMVSNLLQSLKRKQNTAL